jgi:Pirin C-terminal cupin domain
MPISWLNHKPHAIAVYASWPALPSAHATLATGRPATALPAPVFHRLDCTSFRWRLRKFRLVLLCRQFDEVIDIVGFFENGAFLKNHVISIRYLLCDSVVLEEPIVGRGPFVMNTEAQLRQAFLDFGRGASLTRAC